MAGNLSVNRTIFGYPMELDIDFLACFVHKLESMDTKTFHMSVVLWNSNIIQQERKLQEKEDKDYFDR